LRARFPEDFEDELDCGAAYALVLSGESLWLDDVVGCKSCEAWVDALDLRAHVCGQCSKVRGVMDTFVECAVCNETFCKEHVDGDGNGDEYSCEKCAKENAQARKRQKKAPTPPTPEPPHEAPPVRPRRRFPAKDEATPWNRPGLSRDSLEDVPNWTGLETAPHPAPCRRGTASRRLDNAPGIVPCATHPAKLAQPPEPPRAARGLARGALGARRSPGLVPRRPIPRAR
jgi:hypothetical protein